MSFLTSLVVILFVLAWPFEARAPRSTVAAVIAVLIMGSYISAWRWERTGGILLVLGELAMSGSLFFAATVFQFFIASLIFAAPPLLAGVLFLVAASRAPHA